MNAGHDRIDLIGDASRIAQAILHLVSNAVKFTAQGSVVVTASVTDMTSDEGMLKVSVRDTGIGIPEEVQRKLFGSFMQADASTTRKFGGSGLGLAIAKKSIEQMNGKLELQSKVGCGTEVCFEIPIKKGSAESDKPDDRCKSKEIYSSSL